MNNWQQIQRALATPDSAIPAAWRRLGLAIWGEASNDITHVECLADLPSFVGAEMEDAPIAHLYPAVQRHLDRCDECAARHVELLQVALADLNGTLPKPQHLSAPDLSFLLPGKLE